MSRVAWFWMTLGLIICWLAAETLLGSLVVGKAHGPHARLCAPFAIVLGGLMVCSGWCLLKLRPWARLMLEILSWLAMPATLVYAGYLIWHVYGRRPVVERTGTLLALAIGQGVLCLLLFGTVFVCILVYLRGSSARQALARHGPGDALSAGGVENPSQERPGDSSRPPKGPS